MQHAICSSGTARSRTSPIYLPFRQHPPGPSRPARAAARDPAPLRGHRGLASTSYLARVAASLEKKLGQRVHLAMRFWHPFAKDVLRNRDEGCRVLKVVPLAPYSGHVYGGEMQRLAEAQQTLRIASPRASLRANWGQEPLLVEAFARALGDALAALPDPRRSAAHVLFTAHSLPVAIVREGRSLPPPKSKPPRKQSPISPSSRTPGASSTRARAQRRIRGGSTSGKVSPTSPARALRM